MNMAERAHISVLLIFLWLAAPTSSQQFGGNAGCSLPREVGPCRARIPRFYYNAEEQRCAPFFFGGCRGNANNFESIEECEYRCPHLDGSIEQQQDACANADCPAGTTCVPEEEECQFEPCTRFQCRPNGNGDNPCDSSPCSNGDICVHNPLIQCKRSPCAQYYCQKRKDGQEDTCASVECAQGKICQPRQEPCFEPPCPRHECVENPCHLVDCPPNRPECILVGGKAQCVEGAQVSGNDNNNGNSNDKALRLCSPLPQPGDCSTTLRRWYFNRQTSRCQQYKFGTCGTPDNANRFESKLACEVSCHNVLPCPPPPEEKPGCRLVSQGLHPVTLCPIQQEVCEESRNDCASKSCSPGSTCTVVNGRAACMLSSGKLENNNNSKLIKCSPPPETGKCRASITRWYYNRESGECERFTYGGCGGNRNRYNTQEQCVSTCRDVPPCHRASLPSLPSDCHLVGKELDADLCPTPKIVCKERNTCAVTHCPADSPCQIVDGLARCVKKANNDHLLLMCSQVADAGTGFESIKKWTYNRVSSQCEQFTYTGEGGNANRFLSKEQCEERCHGVAPCPSIGAAPPPAGCRYEGHELNQETHCPQPKLFCENEQGLCFTTDCDQNSVCQVVDGRAECVPKEGDGDNRHAENDQQRLQVCSQLPERGPCPAIVPRWHYNRQTSSCQKFTYGGCQGNENNFETQSSCEKLCAGVEQCPVVSVSHPPVGCRYEGEELSDSHCSVPKLVCDEKEACKVCLNAENCKLTKTGVICIPSSVASSSNAPLPLECKLPKDSGTCDDLLPAFYFDTTTSQCLEFSFSGCRGNENRFSTMKHCERVCISKKKCIIPPMAPPPSGCDYAISADEEGCPTRHELRCADRVVIRN